MNEKEVETLLEQEEYGLNKYSKAAASGKNQNGKGVKTLAEIIQGAGKVPARSRFRTEFMTVWREGNSKEKSKDGKDGKKNSKDGGSGIGSVGDESDDAFLSSDSHFYGALDDAIVQQEEHKKAKAIKIKIISGYNNGTDSYDTEVDSFSIIYRERGNV